MTRPSGVTNPPPICVTLMNGMPVLKPPSKLEIIEWELCAGTENDSENHCQVEPRSFRRYEKAVAESYSVHEDLIVIHDHKIPGIISRTPRQIDVWVQGKLASDIELSVAIECKLHETKKVGIKEIDAFLSVLDDVAANKGVFITNTGFTKGARSRAQDHKLALKIVPFDEVETLNWEEFFTTSSCKSSEGCWGLVSWDLEDDEGNKAGTCDHCGLFHIHCQQCGELDWYMDQHNIQCSSCRNVWEFDGPHDEPFPDSMTLVQRESEMTD